MTALNETTLDDTELARAGLYRLLGAALSHPPTPALLAALRALHPDGAGALADAMRAVAAQVQRAQARQLQAAQREYDTLFVGIARGELVPYASFYLTGFLHDRPLARLRADLAALGLAAEPGHPDPEDHAGTLCEVMAGLIDGQHGAAHGLEAQRRFFDRHVAPWMETFFTDLAASASAPMYASLGRLGRAFLIVERAAFQMEA